MAKKKNVVRIISESRAREILRDLKTMSLEKAGAKHGIRNTDTIPKLIRRAFERADRKVPAYLARMEGGTRPDPVITVGRRGTIIVPKEAVIDSFGFRKSQKFTARKHGKKIILTPSGRGSGRRKKA